MTHDRCDIVDVFCVEVFGILWRLLSDIGEQNSRFPAKELMLVRHEVLQVNSCAKQLKVRVQVNTSVMSQWFDRWIHESSTSLYQWMNSSLQLDNFIEWKDAVTICASCNDLLSMLSQFVVTLQHVEANGDSIQPGIEVFLQTLSVSVSSADDLQMLHFLCSTNHNTNQETSTLQKAAVCKERTGGDALHLFQGLHSNSPRIIY